MIRAALVWLALAAPAAATQDGWPALQDVTGVAAGDVLNIRAAPSAGAPVIGTLAPDATGVEVIRANERLTWGLVNTDERTGWVSLAYLARRPGQWDGAFPAIAACFGTEPFWHLERAEGSLRFEAMGEPPARFAITAESGSANRRHSFHILAEGPTVAVIEAEACSDGMSDRAYGLSVELILGEGPRHLSGCCTLAQ